MKKLLSVMVLGLLFASCEKDTETVTVDSSVPVGTFTASKSGNLTAENGTTTTGMIQLGTDSKGTIFLRLGSNFTTKLTTGTVTVFLSTSATYMANPGAGNPALKLVGIVAANGEKYFKIAGTVPTNFTHVIIWCGSANISFGNGQLL